MVGKPFLISLFINSAIYRRLQSNWHARSGIAIIHNLEDRGHDIVFADGIAGSLSITIQKPA